MTLSRSLAAALFLAPAAAAQQAQSANYRLDDFALAGGGGGAASAGFASFAALQPLSGAEIASANYRATLGFLACWDPQPTNAPVIFGVTPDCGPLAGATPLTITGLNFDKLGAAPTVTVSIGGGAASSVSVASDTLLTCASPAGAAGDQDVIVSSVFGSDTLAGGFHFTAGLEVYGTGTPGCTGAERMGASTCPTVGNAAFQLTCDHAPANALGLGLVGNAQDLAGSDPLALGVLFHVNPFLSTTIIGLDFTSDASGFATAPAPLPNDPAIVGSTLYGQVIWAWGGACPLGAFGLSSSMGLRITFEP
ncbi:MAG TPA: IPT/TIG domain-containing protein, partial [Planctomycetota bacterium]|nr:IPT/TIG domain-containing protein [Planctomycetota bacterium]